MSDSTWRKVWHAWERRPWRWSVDNWILGRLHAAAKRERPAKGEIR